MMKCIRCGKGLDNATEDTCTCTTNDVYMSLQKKDHFGNLALHLALANGASEAIVELIASGYWKAVREKGRDNDLPLHLALANNATEKTVIEEQRAPVIL